MGRKRNKHLNLPPRMFIQVKGKQKYYRYDQGVQIVDGKKKRFSLNLGKDFVLAIQKYAELEIDTKAKEIAVITFKFAADNYTKEVIPTKALQTQKDNLKEISNLIDFFNNPPAPLDKITPQSVMAYMEWRLKRAQKKDREAGKLVDPKKGQIRANREKALLSHIWTYSRRKGYTNLPNPCEVIPGFRERGRDIYVEDEDFLTLWYAADEPMQEYIDLLYATAQRPMDVLNLSERNLKDDGLELKQSKTGKKLLIAWTPALRAIIDRILARKSKLKIRCLNLLTNQEGQPLTYFAARKRFDNLRKATGVKFQLRDIRAKALTDKENKTDILATRKLAGHSKVSMTEHYLRGRKGDKVGPTE